MIYAYTRLRYQVSFYRTIGPLVLLHDACFMHLKFISLFCKSLETRKELDPEVVTCIDKDKAKSGKNFFSSL